MSPTTPEVTPDNSEGFLTDTRIGNAILGAGTGIIGATVASLAVRVVAERPEMPVPPVGAAGWSAFTLGAVAAAFGKRLNEYRPPQS